MKEGQAEDGEGKNKKMQKTMKNHSKTFLRWTMIYPETFCPLLCEPMTNTWRQLMAVPVWGGGHATDCRRRRRRRINKLILTALFGQRRQIRGEWRGRPREKELPLWHVSKTIAAHALQIPAAAAVSSAAVGMHTSRTTASKCIHLFRAPRRNHSVLLSFFPPFLFFLSQPIHPFSLPLRPSRWNLRERHRFSEVENKYRLAVAALDGTRLQPELPEAKRRNGETSVTFIRHSLR